MKTCIIGSHGLIGSALAVRFPDYTSYPTPDTSVIFDFGSHVHPVFEKNPHYEMKQILDRYTTLLQYASDHGIVFVYPSSALVYEKDTEFSRFKKTLEQLAGCYRAVTLGLRIFPVYGPREQRTVISKWCREMKDRKSPVIFGDGEQGRDFIYIDDVVDQIISLVETPVWRDRVVDIGTGVKTSFNSIVNHINSVLCTSIPATYVSPPLGYSEVGIQCQSPLPVKVSVAQGISRILATL
jgi:nucleoside-diphosphate-sugar epimerase